MVDIGIFIDAISDVPVKRIIYSDRFFHSTKAAQKLRFGSHAADTNQLNRWIAFYDQLERFFAIERI